MIERTAYWRDVEPFMIIRTESGYATVLPCAEPASVILGYPDGSAARMPRPADDIVVTVIELGVPAAIVNLIRHFSIEVIS